MSARGGGEPRFGGRQDLHAGRRVGTSNAPPAGGSGWGQMPPFGFQVGQGRVHLRPVANEGVETYNDPASPLVVAEDQKNLVWYGLGHGTLLRLGSRANVADGK